MQTNRVLASVSVDLKLKKEIVAGNIEHRKHRSRYPDHEWGENQTNI